jgi:hypothetical protein
VIAKARKPLAHDRDIASDKVGAASLADIRAQRIRLTRAAAESTAHPSDTLLYL